VCSSLNDSITYWKWNFIHPPHIFSSINSNPVLQTDIAGTYLIELFAYNSYGCHARTEKSIDLSTVNVKAYSDTVIHCGTTINLTASGADHYLWQIRNKTMSTITPDSTSSISFWCHETKPEASIIYVKGLNNDGCTGTDSVKVNCINQELVFVPTAFTPNGDGRNDELKIFMIGAELIYFKIYNRRGQQVFHTTDAMIGWNGELNGEALGVDSYYWVACVKNIDGQTNVFKGDVILVR
jgi:gliding motility-associated-like protein